MSTQRRKVTSCMCGEQADTTTRSSFFSMMAFWMAAWPGSAQVYMMFSAWTTSLRVSARLAMAATSTVPAMLLPQWQTKTPILMAAPPRPAM